MRIYSDDESFNKTIQKLSNRSIQKYHFSSKFDDYSRSRVPYWHVLKSDIFGGTFAMGKPVSVSFISWCQNSATTAHIRIYDTTNNKEIGIMTFNNTEKKINCLTNYDFPATQSIIEFQVKRENKNRFIYISQCTIDFEK